MGRLSSGHGHKAASEASTRRSLKIKEGSSDVDLEYHDKQVLQMTWSGLKGEKLGHL